MELDRDISSRVDPTLQEDEGRDGSRSNDGKQKL